MILPCPAASNGWTSTAKIGRAKYRQVKNSTASSATDHNSRRLSSIRWSSSGALVSSISFTAIPAAGARAEAAAARLSAGSGGSSASASAGNSRMIRSFSSRHFFSISSSSASRITASKPLVKLRAMPRARPTQRPTVRIAVGSSLGPMNSSASSATISSSVESTPNIARRLTSGAARRLAAAAVRWSGAAQG